jgi:ectoine hydroxylase-related dioxygenase (phytanoyl-CoA dioxygenase family)
MQVIKGSHKLGRIEHVLAGEQAGADIARVEEVLKVLPLEYVEMDPGDVLYFHANLLHRSDQNRSEKPRWSMISCYNAARNNPYKESHHPRYTPLHKLPDSEIVAAGNKRFAESDESVWLDTKNDVSATSLQQSS